MKGTANRERKNPVRLMKGYIYKLTDTRNGKKNVFKNNETAVDVSKYQPLKHQQTQ